METLLPWLEHWAMSHIYRNHTLVVVGGGVLTDMGGMASSLYMRGITWHAWPTTLLAQTDAGIGGKVAVNLDSGKNLAGAFYHPQRVVIARAFLDSLSERHLKSGKWELIKMALIEGDLAWARELLDIDAPTTRDIERAIRQKIEMVRRDFKEEDERRLLNLGHTFGHAMESASNFDFLHGEAVGVGLLAACLLPESVGAKAFPEVFIEKMAKRLAHLVPKIPPWESCLPFMLRDKKLEATADSDISGENKVLCIIPVPDSCPIKQKISHEILGAVHAKLMKCWSDVTHK
jgi:3-dehydroquinate synthase